MTDKVKKKAIALPVLLAIIAGVWLWSRREEVPAERPSIDSIIRATIAREGVSATEAEIEATLIHEGYSATEAASIASRVMGDIAEDAAKALYGVAPVDPLAPEDLAIAEEARETIISGDYRADAEGDFIGSIQRAGESTEDFFARQKREKEAARIYKMSQSEWYRAKWGLEPLAPVEELAAPVVEELAAPVVEEVTASEVAKAVEEQSTVPAGFTASVDQLDQLEQAGHDRESSTYKEAVDYSYAKTASETKQDESVAWSSDKGYYNIKTSDISYYY